MSVGRVHLMYGLAGSGKTTRARALCAEGKAVRFTLDGWMLRLYPDLDFAAPGYATHADVVKELIWSVAEQVLATGADVVLDWNSWSRQRRAWAIERARAIGAEVIVHCLAASVAEASARAQARTAARQTYAHPVKKQDNEHLATLMEHPNENEGLTVLRV